MDSEENRRCARKRKRRLRSGEGEELEALPKVVYGGFVVTDLSWENGARPAKEAAGSPRVLACGGGGESQAR